MKKMRFKRAAAFLLGLILAVSPCMAGGRPLFGITGLAEERTASVNATSLNVRSAPGTSNQVVARLSQGAPVTVIGEQTAADGVLWYQIRFSGSGGEQTGYVSSQYIKFPTVITSDADFESYLNSQGFPESYKQGLRELHAQFPSWTFTAFHTNLDWNEVIRNESVIGRNLVSRSSISSWKSTAEGAYDWDTGTWPGFDGNSWVQASEDIIRYYMDPRNFLNEKYIFQFMNQSYDSSIHTREGLENMVSGTFLSGTVTAVQGGASSGGSSGSGPSASGPASGPAASGDSSSSGGPAATGPGASGPSSGDQALISPVASISDHAAIRVMAPSGPGSGGSGFSSESAGDGAPAAQAAYQPAVTGAASYVDIILSAASQSGVNPYILASMILQEQGSQGTGRSISGTVSGYEGYYNFFNIEAYQSGSMGAVERGLWWASQSGSYGRPWNSVEKSIAGGAIYYGENYVKKGQNTLYLKKFNVQGDNLYKHQYMTNVQAAASEGLTLSKITALKTTALEFSIPVYLNMPESACVQPTLDGSPNNKLAALGVDGFALTPTFNRDTESYDLIVDPSVASVTVSATALDSSAIVAGTGTVDLQSGINDITVAVQAQNGAIRYYVLHIVRQQNGPTYTAGVGGLSSGSGSPGSAAGPGATGPGSDVEILGPDSSAQTGGSSSGTSSGGVTPPVETAAPDLSGQSAPGVGVSGFGTEGDGQLIAPGAGAALPGGSGPASGSGSAGGQGAGGGSSSQTGGQAASSSVRGDTNGDGRLNILDVLNAQRHILGLGTLDGAGAAAADVNGNGKVDIMDVLLMQKDILGIEKLN